MRRAIILGLGLAAPAAADVVLYTDRAAFEADAGDLITESFEDESLGAIGPADAFGESALLAWTDNLDWTVEVTDTNAQSYNTTLGGAKHLRFGYGTGTYTAIFELDSMTAFGFDMTGYQDFTNLGGFQLELWNDGAPVESVFIADPGSFLMQFHGIQSTSVFDRVAITILGSDTVGFDEISFRVATVPAPGALALLGLAGLTGRRRRG